MTFAPARGTALRTHRVIVRFTAKGLPGPKPGINYRLGHEHVAEVRRLLRTDMPISEIAPKFGIESQCLRQFIKRRRLCDLKARREFISLQRSLAREEEREARQ